MRRRDLLQSLVFAAALPAAGQQEQKQKEEDLPAAIQVDVDVVNVLCSVRNKQGGLVGNLTKEDFTIFENGKEEPIKYFARETDLPLTIGLLVDISGSQANLIEIERRAAYQFFSQVLRKKDLAFLMSFGPEAELLQDFTSSPALLKRGLEQLRVASGFGGIHPGPVPTASQPRGTILYDAVYLASSEQLKGEVGRKAVVLITDGQDQGSRVKLEKAVEASHKNDVIIYSIYYVDQSAYYGRGRGMGGMGFGMVSDAALRKMSEDTGGRVFHVDRKRSLDEIFVDLQEEMRTQYAIGFSPSNSQKDGSFRKLEVHVRDKALKVQARKGYYAMAR